jgi:hypothetical protein
MSVTSPAASASPRRRLALGAVTAFVAAALVAAAMLVIDRSADARRRPARPTTAIADLIQPPSTGETQQAMAVLATMADAVMRRDPAAWDSSLDISRTSVAFADQQRLVFANLRQLPLSAWQYSLDAALTAPAALRAAAGRLGDRVVILHVTLHYALALTDPQPTADDLWLTLVRRSDGWRLAGEDDAAVVGDVSWRGPWDFGAVIVVRNGAVLAISHPALASAAARYAGLVRQAVPVVDSVLDLPWNRNVTVLVPQTPSEFAALADQPPNAAELAAIAVADRIENDGTVLGARMIINPTVIAGLSAPAVTLVLRHELTHLATRSITSDSMPRWLVEGIADYVGNLGSSLAPAQLAPELAAAVRRGDLPAALPGDSAFVTGTASQQDIAYEQAWLACRMVATHAGQNRLVQFYELVSEAVRSHQDTAAASVSTALRSTLRLSDTEFVAQWRTYLRDTLR